MRGTIAAAARRVGRDPAAVELVAVAKTHPASAVEPLLAADQRSFGENRVQEAQAKWPGLVAATPGIRLHLVGQLQSNKARDAVMLFDVLHAIDRPSLIGAVAAATVATGRRPDCYLQVNIGNEPQKGGVALADLAALLDRARAAELAVVGLMAVPPDGIEPAPFFALLVRRARDLGLAGLSIGMSGDYVTAIELGATCVRVGTALFGGRDASPGP